MFIDAHCHAGTFTGFISGTHPPEALVAAFDRAGVECGMMSTLDTYDMSGANDRTRAACAAQAGVDLFITNDDRLSRFTVPGIQFLVSLDRAFL